ncbi:MAG: methylmalonyl-CoA mutase family protein, partial [Chloroflexota bacterium]
GTQSLHTNSMDEALALPTEKAVQIALRTQQIIAHETGAADSVDPLAGSYMIESLTHDIMTQAESYIAKIDDLGGALQAIEAGFVNKEIQDAAYVYQRAVEKNDEIIVGVNDFVTQEDVEPDLLRVDPAIENAAHARLKDLREKRDNERVSSLRQQLETTAKGDDNLMPLIIECVENEVRLEKERHVASIRKREEAELRSEADNRARLKTEREKEKQAAE